MRSFPYWLEITRRDYECARNLFQKLRGSSGYTFNNSAANKECIDKYLRVCVAAGTNPLVLSRIALERQLKLRRPSFVDLRSLNTLTTLDYGKIIEEATCEVITSIKSTETLLKGAAERAEVFYTPPISRDQLRAYLLSESGDPVVLSFITGQSVDDSEVVTAYLRHPEVYDNHASRYVTKALRALPRFEEL